MAYVTLLKKIVPLTDAQIKALPTTPITIVAAPGANLSVEVLWGRIATNTAAGAYTNINAAGFLSVNMPGTATGLGQIPNDAAITNGSATLLTDLLGTTTNKRAVLTPYQLTEDVNAWGSLPFIEALTGVVDKALKISIDNNGGGNLTGGNAANGLTVTVLYLVI